MELFRGHVGDNGGHDVDAPAQRRRQRLVEVTHEGADAVRARAGDGHRIEVGGYDGGPGMGRAQDRRHRPAPRAQVHGDPVGRQECDRPPGERLRVRPGHEHPWVDMDTEITEAHRPGDPGQRLPAQPAIEQFLDRPDALVRCLEQGVGLRNGSDTAGRGQRVDDAHPFLDRIVHRVRCTSDSGVQPLTRRAASMSDAGRGRAWVRRRGAPR